MAGIGVADVEGDFHHALLCLAEQLPRLIHPQVDVVVPAIPSAFLADAPAFTRRRDVGFMMLSSSDTNELAPAFHTGSLEYPCVPSVQRNNRLRAFWPEPVSIFGSLDLTMLMAVHLCWAFHPACPSDRIDARSLGNHLTAFSASQGCQDVVSAASDKTVTSFAGADRLLQTELQVWFTHFYVISNNHCNPIISHARVTPYFNKVFTAPQNLADGCAKCFAGAIRPVPSKNTDLGNNH